VSAWDGEIPRGSERPNCPNVVFRGVLEAGEFADRENPLWVEFSLRPAVA
jgi:hypothetical protein